MGHLRIPFVIDLLRTDDPAAIRAYAQDGRLDRAFTGRGGLLNRILTGTVRRVIALDGVPLPSVAPRGDPDRERAQVELTARLGAAAQAGTFDDDSVTAVARAVRGLPDAPILEHAVQQAVGRLFAADYVATAETWEAARLIDSAAHSMNPFTALWRSLTGAVTRAQLLLGHKVHDDRAGVHATGIAVHNLVRGFQTMRGLFTYPNVPDPAAGDAIVARCLSAPASVLREALPGSRSSADALRPGTLAVLDLGAAQARDASPEIVFMAGSWAHCPAAAWIPAFIRAVWLRALALEAPRPAPVDGTFRLDASQAEAAHQRAVYRQILGAQLVLQALLGVLLLIIPGAIAQAFLLPPATGLLRIWGLLLLVLAAVYAPGWDDPIYRRWLNVAGVVGRGATAVLYLALYVTLGGGFLWFALFDAAFAAALGFTYSRAILAELMTRP